MRRILIVALLLGCGGSTSGDNNANGGDSTTMGDEGVVTDSSVTPSGNLPCDVGPILTEKCQSCHGTTPQFGAPMSLVAASDFQRASVSNPSKRVYEMVKERINLPPDTVGRMPQKPNPPLNAAELATMNAWLSASAPERTGDCPTPGTDTGVVTDSMTTTTDTSTTMDAPPSTLGCTPDIKVRAASKWTMPKDTRDIYTCYGFDLPTSMKKHIIGIAPKVDNPKIVHHVLLMEHTSTVSPTPAKCSESSIAIYRMLYGWAPGVGSYEMPPAAGLPAEAGTTHFVVQIHYNNVLGLTGEADDSGFDLCSTTTLRPNDADVVAFGSRSFTINPKSKLDQTYAWKSTMGDIHVIGAFPHMHNLGKKIVATAGGGTLDIGKDLAFDFNNQYFQPIPDVLVKNGDTVRVNCAWENPTDRTVTWGENTDDEMCFSFTMYYPKVKTAFWSWMLPSQLSKAE